MKYSVLLLPTAAASLFPSYIGLSIELIGFPQWAGTKSKPNDFSNNLINNLVHAQNEHLVVRVGGNSADRAILDKTLTTSTASACPNADPGAYQCIGTSFFDSYGAFPAGTIYSHNFNLATWNSSGFNTLQETVPLACKALKGQLMAWEMGNEPDLFTGNRRPSDYSVDQYLSEWFNATERFQDYLQTACPDMANDVKYIFPSVSSPGSRLRAPDMFAKGGNKLQAVSQISVHNYMGGATQPGVTLQSTLMNHTAVERSIGGHVNYAKSISASSGADYTIGEQNSLYGGGAAGLSDVFGAALWGMDFALYAASTGVIKRVHFHQSIGSPYAAWAPGAEPATKPPYYGQLAAATFLANSAQLEVKTLQLGEKDFDSGYAAYKRGRLVRLAAINLREFDGGDGKQRGSKKYTVQARPFSRWTVKRLSAQGAKAQTGITFNGLAYEAASMGRGVRVAGRECDQVAWADARGRLTFTVADSEAVVLV